MPWSMLKRPRKIPGANPTKKSLKIETKQGGQCKNRVNFSPSLSVTAIQR